MDEGGGDGRGYDAGEWITTLEASRLFGFANDWSAVKACRREGIEEKKVSNPYNGSPMCLFRRSQVERLLAAREHEAWLKAQGLKRCSGCGEWKDRTLEFANRVHDCRPCAKARYKREWAQKKKRQGRRAFWEEWGGDRVPGSVDEYVGKGAPPRAADSLKYACLDEGFSHRPCLPGEKRKRFCANCTAESCYHHPDLTPAEVKEKGAPTLYPEHQAWSYAGGR